MEAAIPTRPEPSGMAVRPIRMRLPHSARELSEPPKKSLFLRDSCGSASLGVDPTKQPLSLFRTPRQRLPLPFALLCSLLMSTLLHTTCQKLFLRPNSNDSTNWDSPTMMDKGVNPGRRTQAALSVFILPRGGFRPTNHREGEDKLWHAS